MKAILIFLIAVNMNCFATEICAHRGGSLLVPENSKSGLLYAIDHFDPDRIDMDVGMTKDGEIVISHDLTLNNSLHIKQGHFISDGPSHVIKNLNYEELSDYRVGRVNPKTYHLPIDEIHEFPLEPISKLNDLIATVEEKCNCSMRYQIELKSDHINANYVPDKQMFVQKIAEIITQFNLFERAEIQSFDWSLLVALKKLIPQVQTSFVTDNAAPGEKELNLFNATRAGYSVKNFDNNFFLMLQSLGATIWSADHNTLSHALVKQAHQHNIKVATWTVNREEDMRKVIDFGVDTIITDHPLRCHSILNQTAIMRRAP